MNRTVDRCLAPVSIIISDKQTELVCLIFVNWGESGKGGGGFCLTPNFFSHHTLVPCSLFRAYSVSCLFRLLFLSHWFIHHKSFHFHVGLSFF